MKEAKVAKEESKMLDTLIFEMIMKCPCTRGFLASCVRSDCLARCCGNFLIWYHFPKVAIFKRPTDQQDNIRRTKKNKA